MNNKRLLPGLVMSLICVALMATVSYAVPNIINISARANSTGLITGFVIEGSQAKTVLIRAVGPALADPVFKVTGTIPDPQVVVYNSQGVVLARNDDWASTNENKANARDTGAFPIAADSKDAMVVLSLPPGAYTAVVQPSDKDPRTGVCLIEVYDLSFARQQNLNSRLVNASIRMIGIGSGNNSAIVGVVFAGDGAQQLLVRAVGPALAQFGVTGVMADPKLFAYSTQTTPATLLGQNDNWSSGSATASTFATNGAFPLPANSTDAALVIPVEVRGTVNRTFVIEGTGAFLAELYLFR